MQELHVIRPYFEDLKKTPQLCANNFPPYNPGPFYI